MSSEQQQKTELSSEQKRRKELDVPKDTARMLEEKQQAQRCQEQCRNKLAEKLYEQEQWRSCKHSKQAKKQCDEQCKCGVNCTCKLGTYSKVGACTCTQCSENCRCDAQCSCRKKSTKKQGTQETKLSNKPQKQLSNIKEEKEVKGMSEPKDLIDLSVQPQIFQPKLDINQGNQELRKQFYNQKNLDSNNKAKEHQPELQRKDQLTPRSGDRILKQLKQDQINEQKIEMQGFKQAMKKKGVSSSNKGDENTNIEKTQKQMKKKNAV